MRKNYIDNLRVFCILLLFPFHTGMLYNDWGEAFYIHSDMELPLTYVMSAIYPWWMTLLFVIAGISAYYALSNRSTKEFLLERVKKLLIPLLVGVVTIVPMQTYIADRFHNGYTGNFFEHYVVYFTRFTDLSGYDGGFTPAHLWFILYLFLISVVLLPFMKKYADGVWKCNFEKLNYAGVFSLFILILLCTPILEIGKSMGEALACFSIGFFVLSNDQIQEKVEKNVVLSGALAVVFLVIRLWLWRKGDYGIILDIMHGMWFWSVILFLLGLWRKYFNDTNPIMTYLSRASFWLYYIHQTVLVVLGYYVLKYIDVVWMQYITICFGTFLISVLCYEIIRRSRLLRRA